MSVRPGWDDQFAEDEDKRRERWRQTKAKRIAAGKCWQCALPFAECRCWVARQGGEAMEATCQPRLPEWKTNDLEKHWKT